MIQPELTLTLVPQYSCTVRQQTCLKCSATGSWGMLTSFVAETEYLKAHLLVVLRQH